MAGIPIIDGFNLSKSGPLDQRIVAADQTARLALTWLYKGLLCYQVDNDTIYKYIGTPNSNLISDWDVVLNVGPQGDPGSVWFNGSGVPAGGLGIDGDYYLDNTNGDVYQKQTGSWVIVSNLLGPTGASGVGAGDYASIRVIGGASGQSIDSTFVKCNQFTVNGSNSGAVPDHTNDLITINSPGSYLIFFNGEWQTSLANETFELQFRLGGIDISGAFMATSFSGTSNTSENINLIALIEIDVADIPGDLELFIRCTSGTNTFTALNASFGIAGLNIKGDQGDAGKALIHLENDIVLDDSKITAVQAGSYTIQNPYAASVLADSRSSLSVPAALTGNKTGHSIAYDGTSWFDNGIWRGPSGPQGTPGAAGAPGAAGSPGVGSQIFFFTFSPGSHSVVAQPEPAGPNGVDIVYNLVCNGTGSFVFTLPVGTFNKYRFVISASAATTGTTVRITNTISLATGQQVTNVNLPVYYSTAYLSTTQVWIIDYNATAFSYSLTFPAPNPGVIPPYRAGTLTTSNPVNTTLFAVTTTPFLYTMGSYFASVNQNFNRQFKIFFLAEIGVATDFGATTVRMELERNVDGGAYTIIKTRDAVLYTSTGASFPIRDLVMHHLDNTLPTGSFTQLSYRLRLIRLSGGTLYRAGNVLDATILPVYTGDSIL